MLKDQQKIDEEELEKGENAKIEIKERLMAKS